MWLLPLPHVHIAPSRFCLFHAIFTPLSKIFTTSTPTKPHVLWYVPRRSGRFRRRWSIWFLYFDYVHSFHMNHFRHPIHHILLSYFAMPWPVVMARFASPKHNPSCIVHVPPSFRPSPSSSNFLWSSFLLSSLSFLMLTSLDRVPQLVDFNLLLVWLQFCRDWSRPIVFWLGRPSSRFAFHQIGFRRVYSLLDRVWPIGFGWIGCRLGQVRPISSWPVQRPFGPELWPDCRLSGSEYRPDHLPIRLPSETSFLDATFRHGFVLFLLAATFRVSGLTLAHGDNRRSL